MCCKTAIIGFSFTFERERALKHIKSSVNLWQSFFNGGSKKKQESFKEILLLWEVNKKVITDMETENINRRGVVCEGFGDVVA